jgi:hypothetical protein
VRLKSSAMHLNGSGCQNQTVGYIEREWRPTNQPVGMCKHVALRARNPDLSFEEEASQRGFIGSPVRTAGRVVKHSAIGKMEAKVDSEHVTQRAKNSHFLLEREAPYRGLIGSLYEPTKGESNIR